MTVAVTTKSVGKTTLNPGEPIDVEVLATWRRRPGQSHHRLSHHRRRGGRRGGGAGQIDNATVTPNTSGMEEEEVLGCRVIHSRGFNALSGIGQQIHHQSTAVVEEQVDPFSLVAAELSLVTNRLRSMVVAKVPKLASAAEYFFKMGVEGKRFRPTILLLMATALNVPIPRSAPCPGICVASLLHDDVLDDADTRRGIGSLNFVMGNKIAVLTGDFLLSRACVALASLKNTEVVSLMATAVKHLVSGETMQITTSSDERCSMEHYMQKTYYKTGSLLSNSCKTIALLAGHTAEVSILAFDYGKNLGLAFQLIDDVLDFTGTSATLGKGSLSDIRHALDYLGKSRGMQRTCKKAC
ncbi:hypothetical protein K7X08_006893 [Anisodus acutangulus]|uniref:Uncharacterized protein n=1 Tax=Anisodus acutangulus TaxID=402998 RepID=A0A9Q1R124_9SOLA|nr:hypothetical protein K7X08_006893 [Anisodus acutangulus]